jgi:hypothetical protein
VLTFISKSSTPFNNSKRLPASAISLLTALLISSTTAAIAQRNGQFEAGLQSAMQMEQRANSSESWRAAGEMWLAQGAMVSKVPNHQDWVKDRIDPTQIPIAISVHKRAIACFVKAYELEGQHETPLSRDQSISLRSLTRAYQSAIRVDPGNPDWHYLYGESLCSKGWYKDGNVELSKAISLGGASGSKASALAAHIKPYVQHEVAAEQALTRYNAKVAAYQAAHPQMQQNSTDAWRHAQGVNTALYFMNRDK